MDTPADFTVEDDGAERKIVLTGDWSAISLGRAGARLAELMRSDFSDVDLRQVGRFDTAGALALVDAAGGKLDKRQVLARPATQRLLERVEQAVRKPPRTPKRRLSFNRMLNRIGRGVINFSRDFIATLGFNGRLIVTVGRSFIRPDKVRWATVFNVTERAGIDAIPIVVVTNLFIGAVIAFLAAGMLADVGLQTFSVETVGFGVLREFGIVITAILLAGRSASSFAAEIGSMKMQQEIDAMRTMGVDPFDALVLPRFLALLFILPLTFLAVISGLFAGAMILWWNLDLSPIFFMKRIQEEVGVDQFYLSLWKAPFMAAAIAAIGCRQGMLVGGDVESLGRHVTSAVVQSIFSIIMLDAIFALIFLELDL